MIKLFRKMKIATLFFVPMAFLVLSLMACEEEGPIEEAGENIEEAAEETQEEVNELEEKIEENN